MFLFFLYSVLKRWNFTVSSESRSTKMLLHYPQFVLSESCILIQVYSSAWLACFFVFWYSVNFVSRLNWKASLHPRSKWNQTGYVFVIDTGKPLKFYTEIRQFVKVYTVIIFLLGGDQINCDAKCGQLLKVYAILLLVHVLSSRKKADVDIDTNKSQQLWW